MTLGEKINLLRKKKGLSQAELAYAAGYDSRSSIAKIEKGVSDPSQKALSRIADALEVKASDLISDDDPIDKPVKKHQGEPVYLKHDEVRIMARGFDRMPEEKRKKAFDLAKMIFSEYAEYFEEGADDDDA